ncbi:MAG: putative membrane protein [Cenarchaeum symbiont of Oopsacas minuta]|nr:putative membrane protein [Cenarchaeum symbiont of Oopsacas minuta]
MSDPHNYRKVGYSMILVSASLVSIALIGIAIGEDVLYGDKIQRESTAHFEECLETDFVAESCQPYMIHMKYEQCVAEKDIDSKECFRYRTWVESAIFEECRANNDTTSMLCIKYKGNY